MKVYSNKTDKTVKFFIFKQTVLKFSVYWSRKDSVIGAFLLVSQVFLFTTFFKLPGCVFSRDVVHMEKTT